MPLRQHEQRQRHDTRHEKFETSDCGLLFVSKTWAVFLGQGLQQVITDRRTYWLLFPKSQQ